MGREKVSREKTNTREDQSRVDPNSYFIGLNKRAVKTRVENFVNNTKMVKLREFMYLIETYGLLLYLYQLRYESLAKKHR